MTTEQELRTAVMNYARTIITSTVNEFVDEVRNRTGVSRVADNVPTATVQEVDRINGRHLLMRRHQPKSIRQAITLVINSYEIAQSRAAVTEQAAKLKGTNLAAVMKEISKMKSHGLLIQTADDCLKLVSAS